MDQMVMPKEKPKILFQNQSTERTDWDGRI